MPRKSATDNIVRRRASETPPLSAAELEQLRAGMDAPIDTSDIPEAKGPLRQLGRDSGGRLPQPLPELRDSPIRLAILKQLDRRQMNRYQLWRAAQARCARLPKSAVYEYLRGQRAIGLPYAEALIDAAGLTVVPRRDERRTKAALTT